MTAAELVRAAKGARLFGDGATRVGSIVLDSREAQPGSLFVAVRGVHTDGHLYIEQAVRSGASVVAAETEPTVPTAAWIQAPNTRRALADLADAMYGYPARELTLAGVTGTNGKTSTTYFLKSVFEAAGMPCARIGTTGHEAGGRTIEARSTTPDPIEMNALLREAVDKGGKAAAMEVSSHALDQGRLISTRFDAAIFTNLTQDHLDYHGTMEAYGESKRQLFRQLKPDGAAIANIDDPKAGLYLETADEIEGARLVRFGFSEEADVRADNLESTASFTAFDLVIDGRNAGVVRLQLLGEYNALNALAAAAAGHGLGFSAKKLIDGMESVDAIPGRFQSIDEGQPFRVIVDYAHTPDALERLLLAARALKPTGVIVVFGCGGDRDPGKRPKMGEIAGRLADLSVVTSDNPRGEKPEAIIEQIEKGMPEGANRVSETDRKAAIRIAVDAAKPGSVALIAGKGHETYQETNGVRASFDDREAARACLRAVGYGV